MSYKYKWGLTGFYPGYLQSVEWNAGMEWWNGITKQGSQNSTRNSRINRVDKNNRSGDQLIKDRELGDRGPG